MVEMLGILAIIGVLSIGSLSIYNVIMMRWRMGKIQDWFSRARFAMLENCYYEKQSNKCILGSWSNKAYVKNRTLLCISAGDDFCNNSTASAVPFAYLPNVSWIVNPNFDILTFFLTPKLDKKTCEAMIDYDWHNLHSISDYSVNFTKSVPHKGAPLSQIDKATLKACCPFSYFFQINFYPED